MHLGRYNNSCDYYITNHLIIKSTCENILGIFMNTIHFTEHIYDCKKQAK